VPLVGVIIRMCIGLHIKYRYSCPILMKLTFSWQIFEKYSNIKIHENPKIRAESFHGDGRTDMTKKIVSFRNSANAPKIKLLLHNMCSVTI